MSNLLEEMLSNSNFMYNRDNSNASITQIKKQTQDQTERKIHQAVNMLRADQSASFDDFIEIVAKLICLTMDDLDFKIEFIPQDGQEKIIDPDVKTDKVYITYNLVSRVPLREIKPMPREEIMEKSDITGEERRGMIYGQKYKCDVQFNIFASEYKIANKVMKMFEDMLFSFTGYMKEKGVSNILFKQQFTDTNFNLYRKSMSVRNLRYDIEIENLIVLLSDTVEQVIMQGSL